MVHADGIAHLGLRPVQRSDLCLQRQDGVGAATRIVDAGALERRLDVVAIGGAVADERLARKQVIFGRRQAEAGLHDLRHVALGLAGIEPDADADHRGREGTRHPARHLVIRGDRQHRRHIVLDRREAERVQAIDVEIALEHRLDERFVAARRGVGSDDPGDQFVELLLGIQAGVDEGVGIGEAVGDLRAGQPAFVDIAVEIIAGVDRRVDVLRLDAPAAECCALGVLRQTGRCASHETCRRQHQ